VWWGQVSWVARAAGVLVAAALSLQLTLPETVSAGALRLPGARGLEGAQAAGGGPRDGPKAPPAPPLEYGTLDATLELRAPLGLAQALAAADALVRARAQVLAQRVTDEQVDLLITVSAKLIDDLYRELDALAEVAGTPAAATAVEAVTTEQDRVVLKNGIVLAGRVESETAQQVVVVTGALRQTLRMKGVLRVERAEQTLRRVRLTLRGGAP
jgi:hypothetical protein